MVEFENMEQRKVLETPNLEESQTKRLIASFVPILMARSSAKTSQNQSKRARMFRSMFWSSSWDSTAARTTKA